MEKLESDPNNAKVRNSLGMLYWQRGEAKKAIEDLVRALRINPNFLDAVLNLGDILTKIKENEKAEKLYSSYLSMNPQNKDLFEVLASRDN
jgi:Tfp pilus assembly protein PilF